MKRVIVICCVLMCFGGVEMAQAQSLKDILNSSKVKDVVNLVTGNVIKFSVLQGTWNYVEPACKMTSGDLLKEASGSLVTSALEKKMVNIYTKLGIVPGNFSYTFSNDSTFTNTIGKKVLKGTYSLDEKTRVLTLRYMLAKTITVKSVEVQLVKSGEQVSLLFNIEKLMNFVSVLSSALKKSDKTTPSLMDGYDEILLGFEMKK